MSRRPSPTLVLCLAGSAVAVASAALGLGAGSPAPAPSPAPPATTAPPATVAGGGGYGSATPGPTATAPAQPAAAPLTIEGFAFASPPSAAPGATVTVDNRDGADHTVTADDGSFESGTVASGAQGSLTAPTEAGQYAYFCSIHPEMTGTLTVG